MPASLSFDPSWSLETSRATPTQKRRATNAATARTTSRSMSATVGSGPAEGGTDAPEVGRERGREARPQPTAGVGEGQAVGVKERPAEIDARPAAAVPGVAEDWMADGVQVHSDLMRAPRLEAAFDCRRRERLEQPLLDV